MKQKMSFFDKVAGVANHPSRLVRYFLYFLGIMILSLLYYIFTATMSIATRGEISQTYWYCSWDMGRNLKEGIKCPHHYGYKPAIPLVDHVCGTKELKLAREADCKL